MRDVQKRAVVHAGVMRDSAANHVRIPRVDVAVEVNHTDGPPALMRRPQRRQRRRMIASQRQDSRRLRNLRCICRAARYSPVGSLQLGECDGVVKKGERRVAAVDDPGPGPEAVRARVDGPAEGGRDAAGAVADAVGAVAGTRAGGYALIRSGEERKKTEIKRIE